MADWPPNPNKSPEQNQQPVNQPTSTPANTGGKEWQLLEKTLMASIDEQRRARRWSIFFKLLTFAYIIFFMLMVGRGCSTSPAGLEGMDTSSPHLAVIDVNGVISGTNEANSHDINKALTKAFENEQAKAVVLNINSPGGSPVQSDEIWLNMRELKKQYPDKKLYATIGDMGASGAYYIASAADEIWVNPSSLVGSIGVIMPNYNVEKLMDKLGVKDRTMTAGEYKDILSMSRQLTDFESQHVEGVLANVHQHFIDAVKQGRGKRLKDPEANHLFTGLFWTGEQAITLGLADKTGGVQAIEKSMDLDNVINYTPVDPMHKLLESFAVKMGTGIGSSLQPDLANLEHTTTLQ